MLNNNEKKFIEILNEAKKYVKGELELDCVDGEWFAMDYREDFECALPINTTKLNNPLITNKEAKRKGIDVVKCCDECGIYYVG